MEQARRLAVTSRAYHTETARAVSREASSTITGLDMALPMNTGAEAVETAIKAARRWGYRFKNIREGSRRNHRRGIRISTAARPRSSAFRRTNPTARVSARSTAASGRCRSATSQAVARRHHAEYLRRSSSSRFRARPASSCRRRAICASFARSATSAACC